ncbi:MAG TPA: hypothetical protein VF042_00690 [Gemmatimonadaceae bacterium]
MRRIALMSSMVGVCLIAACGKAKDGGPDTAVNPPPPPPPPVVPTNQATIIFSCSNGGANISVVPWRVREVTEASGVKFRAPQNAVWIVPKDPNHWPFDTNRIDVKGDTTVKNFKPVVDIGTYKYVVYGVCVNGTEQDTVILDPDMIIPTKIQRQ